MDSVSLKRCEDALTRAIDAAKAHSTMKNVSTEYTNICGLMATILASQHVIIRHMRDVQTDCEKSEEAIEGAIAMVERAVNGGKNDG